MLFRDKKQPDVMPICYFPTTVFLVDDDVAYTKLLKRSLSSKFIVQAENNSERGLDFLNNKYQQDPFWLRALHRAQPKTFNDQGELIFTLPEIKQMIYNKDRFKQVTVVIVDYAMPGLKGDQFLKQVKTRENAGYPVIRLIMLTGKDYSPAGILDELNAFYKKDDDISKLINKATGSQTLYFEEASLGIAFYLKCDPRNKTLCLMDEVFIKFLKDVLKEHNIAEYYMIDTQGSFLMLDADANLSWFLVRNEIGMEQTIKLARQYEAPQGVIQALERREKLLYIPDENGFQENVVDWNDYLHSVQVLQGQEKYYYAHVKNLKHHGIERDRILSYEEYLNSIL